MVTDIAPTLLHWLDVPPPPASAKPMTGRSLLPVLKGEQTSAYAPGEPRAIEVSGNSALYKGDYKITRSMPPVGDGQWRLFNLTIDPGETTDLSEASPNILADLIEEFDAYAERVGVLPMPEGFNTSDAVLHNSTKRFLSHYPMILVGLFVLLAALGFGLWRAGQAVAKRVRS